MIKYKEIIDANLNREDAEARAKEKNVDLIRRNMKINLYEHIKDILPRVQDLLDTANYYLSGRRLVSGEGRNKSAIYDRFMEKVGAAVNIPGIAFIRPANKDCKDTFMGITYNEPGRWPCNFFYMNGVSVHFISLRQTRMTPCVLTDEGGYIGMNIMMNEDSFLEEGDEIIYDSLSKLIFGFDEFERDVYDIIKNNL